MSRPSSLRRRDTHGRPGYRQDDIVDIAVRVFLERGYDGTSMSDLARAAGVTKSSFYHHVAGKEELFERGTNRALDALFLVLDEPPALEGPALARVRHVLHRTVEVITEHQPEVALLVRARGNTPVEAAAVVRRREFDHALTRLVRHAIREGGLRTTLDPGVFSRLALGTAVSVVEWYRPDGGMAPGELVEAVDHFIFGAGRGAGGAEA